MIELNEKQIVDYYRRSYLTVDGLWFMKVEERYGFDIALDTDNAAWKVMSKIQARLLKNMMGLPDGLEGLADGIATKITLDGSEIEVHKNNPDSFEIVVTKCPWHDLRVKSGRVNISPRVGDVICDSNMSVFAAEFGKDIKVTRPRQICHGDEFCRFLFSRI